jgi:hypothetical protein
LILQLLIQRLLLRTRLQLLLIHAFQACIGALIAASAPLAAAAYTAASVLLGDAGTAPTIDKAVIGAAPL